MRNKNAFKKIILFSAILIIILSLNMELVYASGNGLKSGFKDAFIQLFNEYKVHIAGFMGVGVITSILAYIINLVRLATSSTNSQKRTQVIKELIAISITTAVLGSLTVFVGLFYSIFA